MKKAVVLLSVVLLLSGFCLIAYSAPIFGDVNSDGSITADDARTVLRASVGLTQLSDEEKIFADMNRDGRITADDARTILRISVDLEPVPTADNHIYIPSCGMDAEFVIGDVTQTAVNENDIVCNLTLMNPDKTYDFSVTEVACFFVLVCYTESAPVAWLIPFAYDMLAFAPQGIFSLFIQNNPCKSRHFCVLKRNTALPETYPTGRYCYFSAEIGRYTVGLLSCRFWWIFILNHKTDYKTPFLYTYSKSFSVTVFRLIPFVSFTLKIPKNNDARVNTAYMHKNKII